MTTTLGPKIIRDESADEQLAVLATTTHTGIRRTNSGGWAAVKDGRLIDIFTGVGSKAAAIQAAGSNAVIA
jgi:hypothetical protein